MINIRSLSPMTAHFLTASFFTFGKVSHEMFWISLWMLHKSFKVTCLGFCDPSNSPGERGLGQGPDLEGNFEGYNPPFVLLFFN